MFTNCNSIHLIEQSVSKAIILSVLSSTVRHARLLFNRVLCNLLFVNNGLQVSSIRLVPLWYMYTKIRPLSEFWKTHTAIICVEAGQHTTERVNFPAILLRRIMCPNREIDNSNARNVRIEVKWKFCLHLDLRFRN